MENDVQIKIQVESEGLEKVPQTDQAMGKLQKTTDNTGISNKKLGESTALYNTSLIKTIPQMQVMNPLMSALGLSSIMTSGGLGLLGLGLLKVGQTALEVRNNIVDLGVAMGQYTSGPVQDFNKVNQEATDLSNQMFTTHGQTAEALTKLISVTHDYGIAAKLLDDANKASIVTNKSLSEIVDTVAQAYSQGAMIGGKQMPAGMGAAEAVANLYQSEDTAPATVISTLKRFVTRGFESYTWGPEDFFKNMVTPFGGQTSPAATAPGGTSTVNVQIDGTNLFKMIWDRLNNDIRVVGGH